MPSEMMIGIGLGFAVRFVLCLAATLRGKWGFWPWMAFPVEITIGMSLAYMYHHHIINNTQMEMLMVPAGILILIILVGMTIFRRKSRIQVSDPVEV